jgi:site-specific DNA-methyltransferase (adenine-specific)
VTLFHGDCLEVTEWLEADVLVTDPPYGIKNESKKGSYAGAGSQTRKYNPIANDENLDVRDAVLDYWGTRPSVVFGSWKMPRPPLTKHLLVWHKKGQAPGPANSSFMVQHEEIYIWGDGFVSTSPPMRSVITTSEPRSIAVAKIGHPTPKPVGLMELLIGRCPEGVIADPFSGSGSTLVAARNLGRRSIGVEMEEKYCELIANRLSQQSFVFEDA